MECILAGFTIEECLTYTDDIINFSDTFEQHLGALKKSAAVTAGTGMSLKPSKGHFLQKEVTYLGHKASAVRI